MLRSTFIVPALTVLLLAGAGAAQAQDRAGREATTLSVKLSDAGLNSSEGANQAYARLSRAANAACASDYNNDLRARAEDKGCARAALDQAVADLGRPAISRLHAEKTGQSQALYAERQSSQSKSSK